MSSPSSTFLSHFENSLEEILTTLSNLRKWEPCIEEIAQKIVTTLTSGHKLLFCGNGGSASDSSHIACEFTCRFCEDRRPFPAIALAAEPGLLTAIGNDYQFEELFRRQVIAFGQPGDILIGLSTSGNSANVIAALQEGNRRGLTTVAFLGHDGGKAAGIAQLEVIIPGKTTARIQEAHKFLLHVICEIAEKSLVHYSSWEKTVILQMFTDIILNSAVDDEFRIIASLIGFSKKPVAAYSCVTPVLVSSTVSTHCRTAFLVPCSSSTTEFFKTL